MLEDQVTNPNAHFPYRQLQALGYVLTGAAAVILVALFVIHLPLALEALFQLFGA